MLHWRFDEAGGTIALDTSGNGLYGAFVGEGILPEASDSVPPSAFPNPRSRRFVVAGRPAVLLRSAAFEQLPTTGITFALWFRTTDVGTGADLVNLNDGLLLRMRSTIIEIARRKSNVPTMIYDIARLNDVTSHLDDQWHHVAGVVSSSGLDLYLDGALRAHDGGDDHITIVRPDPLLSVGRGAFKPGFDYGGYLDDVRLYARALSAAEIAQLARGQP